MLDKYASTACLLASIKPDQPLIWGPLGPVRGPGIWKELPGRQKLMLVLVGPVHACVFMKSGNSVCAPVCMTSCVCQTKRGFGHWCSCSGGCCQSSVLPVAACSPCCLVCVCVFLWDSCLAVKLIKSTNGRTAMKSTGLSHIPRLQAPPGLGSCGQERKFQVSELQRAVATYYIPSDA